MNRSQIWPTNEYDINLNVKAFPSQRIKYFGSPQIKIFSSTFLPRVYKKATKIQFNQQSI